MKLVTCSHRVHFRRVICTHGEQLMWSWVVSQCKGDPSPGPLSTRDRVESLNLQFLGVYNVSGLFIILFYFF